MKINAGKICEAKLNTLRVEVWLTRLRHRRRVPKRIGDVGDKSRDVTNDYKISITTFSRESKRNTSLQWNISKLTWYFETGTVWG